MNWLKIMSEIINPTKPSPTHSIEISEKGGPFRSIYSFGKEEAASEICRFERIAKSTGNGNTYRMVEIQG